MRWRVNHDRETDSLVGGQPSAGAARHTVPGGLGRVLAAQPADRRTAGPVGRASDHPYLVPRAGATDRRKPGHLPADNHHALGTGGQDRARLLGLR